MPNAGPKPRRLLAYKEKTLDIIRTPIPEANFQNVITSYK